MKAARKELGEEVEYAETMYEAARGADALLLTTEWKEFRVPDWETLAATMRGRAIFDGRNIYDAHELTERGFKYYGIGV